MQREGDELAVLEVGDRTLRVRRARRGDVAAIVGLLAEDQIGEPVDAAASAADLDPYLAAFDAIDADPAQLLVVGEEAGEVVATLQLTLLPGLIRRGGTRGQIEAVRVRSDRRGAGTGAALVGWAVGEARRRGATLVQLTSHRQREAAHRFYRRLGFEATHEGFKLHLQ